MNREQSLHVGMINSYNLLTEKASFRDIVDSGVGVFAHMPDEDIVKENVEFIIYYFQELQMFEYCAELNLFVKENFNKDGSRKDIDCKCELPDISIYKVTAKCERCGKRLQYNSL